MAPMRFNAPLRRISHLLSSSEGVYLSHATPRRLPAMPQATHPSLVAHASQLLSTTPRLEKKRKIAGPREDAHKPEPVHDHHHKRGSNKVKSADEPTGTTPEDPLDFSSVIAAFATIDAHFKSQLQTLTHGGKFNPTSLGALPVPVKDANHQLQTFPLSELAQIVARSGTRTISLLVNDRQYIKPIMSAVQACRDFNQQPQRSEDNDLELLLRVEVERKEDVVKRVKEATQTWRERVRGAKTKHEKTLKAMVKNKTTTMDMGRKAEKELQKLQDKKMKEIDDEEARTVKAIGR